MLGDGRGVRILSQTKITIMTSIRKKKELPHDRLDSRLNLLNHVARTLGKISAGEKNHGTFRRTKK